MLALVKMGSPINAFVTALSLGNRLPYSVDYFPSRFLDVLYTTVSQ